MWYKTHYVLTPLARSSNLYYR